MTVNFRIEDNYALTYKGQHIDLHNNFNFIGYNYIVADRQLTLTWTKLIGEWVSENELSRLTLIHSNVFFININYDSKEYQYPEDDNCLGNISFFPSSYRQINNSHTSQDTPNDGDDVIYYFETESYIRVGCDRIELKIE